MTPNLLLGAPLLIFPRVYLHWSFPQEDACTWLRGFEIRVFSLLCELPKANEPHLQVCQVCRCQLGPNMWSSPTTKSLDAHRSYSPLGGLPRGTPQTRHVRNFMQLSYAIGVGNSSTSLGLSSLFTSPRSIMVHLGFVGKEVRRARQKYQSRQTASHSSLLVARQGDASRKLNQASLLVDTSYSNFYSCRTFKYIIYVVIGYQTCSFFSIFYLLINILVTITTHIPIGLIRINFHDDVSIDINNVFLNSAYIGYFCISTSI